MGSIQDLMKLLKDLQPGEGGDHNEGARVQKIAYKTD
jgi:hypothetical protein